jgi:hypothetical protein
MKNFDFYYFFFYFCMTFYLLRMMYMHLQEVIKKKLRKKVIFVGVLKDTYEKSRIRILIR